MKSRSIHVKRIHSSLTLGHRSTPPSTKHSLRAARNLVLASPTFACLRRPQRSVNEALSARSGSSSSPLTYSSTVRAVGSTDDPGSASKCRTPDDQRRCARSQAVKPSLPSSRTESKCGERPDRTDRRRSQSGCGGTTGTGSSPAAQALE